jgi:DNA-binding CsgD family transcriptional regulator
MSVWQRLHQAFSSKAHAASPEAESAAHAYHFHADLLQALSLLAERESRPIEQIAAELLSQALARRQAAEASLPRWESLSPREQQVAALVCLHLTDLEIASYLGISPETVKSHVQGIFTKFNLHRRSELRLVLADWDFSEWSL